MRGGDIQIKLTRWVTENASMIKSDEAAETNFSWQKGCTLMQVELFEIKYKRSINWAAMGAIWFKTSECIYTGQSVMSKAAAESLGRKWVLPLTLLSLHCLYCLSLCRWSSLNRTPAPPSVCTQCSTWTPGMRSTPTGTIITCRSGTVLSKPMLEPAHHRLYTINNIQSWSKSWDQWKTARVKLSHCWTLKVLNSLEIPKEEMEVREREMKHFIINSC